MRLLPYIHIWPVTVGKVLLACHIRINSDADMILDKAVEYIKTYGRI